MSSGQHGATVTIDGRLDGLDKATRGANKRIQRLEKEIEKLSKQAGSASNKIDSFDAALRKSAERAAFAKRQYKNVSTSLAEFSISGRAAFDVLREGASVLSEMAQEGVQASDVFGSLPFSVSKAQAATGGFVSELDLATLAVNANRLGGGPECRGLRQVRGCGVCPRTLRGDHGQRGD